MVGGLLIAVAFLVDVVQGLLTYAIIGFFLDTFISIFASVAFGISFSHYGVSLMDDRRVARFLATIVGEMIPGLNVVLWWTALVSYTVYEEWKSKPQSDAEI